jgi:ribosomal protein S14
LAPNDERPEWCLFPQNFSGTVATYRRVCQVANLGPVPEKKSFFPIFFSLHDLEFIGVWASRFNVPFSLFELQPDKFPSLSRPPFPFFLDYSVPLLHVENSRTHLPVPDFSLCRQSLRLVFLRQDWLGFFWGTRFDVIFPLSRASIVTGCTSPSLSLGRHRFRDLGEDSCTPTKKLSGSPFRCRSCRLCTLELQFVRKFWISGSHGLARPKKKDLTPTE